MLAFDAMNARAVAIGASVLILVGVAAAGASASRSVVGFTSLTNNGTPSRAIPQHLRNQAKELMLAGSHSVWLVPTPNGNFCEGFSYGFGGCRARTLPASFNASSQAEFRIGDTVERRNSAVVAIGGDLLAAPGSSLTVVYADGSQQRIPVTFVSAPISAGFYALTLSPLHQRPGHTPLRLDASDPHGTIISSVAITSH